jgi:hypothetical protein
MIRKTASVAVIASAALAFSALAWAQFSGPPCPLVMTNEGPACAVMSLPGSVTSDLPTEQNTAGIMTSVTTGGGGGNYPGNTTIASLDRGLFANLSSQNFDAIYPAWTQPLPAQRTEAERDTDTRTMAVYHNVVTAAQQNLQELDSEDFSRIFANDTSPNLLTVEQAKLDGIGAIVQELRYLRQLQGDEVILRATEAAYQLNHAARPKATLQAEIVP